MDGSQANSHEKRNKHMEIVITLFARKGIRYDPSSYCGSLENPIVSKASVRRVDKTNEVAQFKTIGTV